MSRGGRGGGGLVGLRLIGGDQTRKKIFMTTVARWYCNRSHKYIQDMKKQRGKENRSRGRSREEKGYTYIPATAQSMYDSSAFSPHNGKVIQ